jgi:hypothetical protein
MAFQEMANIYSTNRLGIHDELENASNISNTSNNVLLAQQVVQIYTNNLNLVKALSVAYGFKSLSYWEPTIYQKGHLTKYETGARGEQQHLEEFLDKTYDLLEKSMPNLPKDCALYDISLIFSDVREPIYLDWCHMGEKGNDMVAQRMAQDVERVVRTNGMAAHDVAPSAGQLFH